MQCWSKHTNCSTWDNVVFTLWVSRCYSTLFFSHNFIIFGTIIKPNLYWKFIATVTYQSIVPRQESKRNFQPLHDRVTSGPQKIHLQNLRIILCKVRLLEVHKFVSLQPFTGQWKIIFKHNASSTSKSKKNNSIFPKAQLDFKWRKLAWNVFLQILLQARFSCKLQRSRHHVVACSCQATFKNSFSHSTRACRKCSWIIINVQYMIVSQKNKAGEEYGHHAGAWPHRRKLIEFLGSHSHSHIPHYVCQWQLGLSPSLQLRFILQNVSLFAMYICATTHFTYQSC